MNKRSKMPTPKRMKKATGMGVVSRHVAKRVLAKTTTRAYSERRETKAMSPMVAYKPYATEQSAGSVDSTAIYSFSYDRKRKLLRITFMRKRQSKGKISYLGAGMAYWFYKVPADPEDRKAMGLGKEYGDFDSFQTASSKGRYFYYFIRTQYKFTRIGGYKK